MASGSVPLGKVTAAIAGTPTRATVNQTDPTKPLMCQSITFQVLPGNAGLVYIQQGSGDDRTLLTKTLGILAKPASATTGPFASVTFSSPLSHAAFNAADYYINVDNNTDGVLVDAICL